MAGTIGYESASVTANTIGKSLLDFIQTLEDTDIAVVPKSTHGALNNELLVLTENKRPEKVAHFFKQLNLPNVTVGKTSLLSELDTNKYDVIIFDNRDLPACFSEKTLIEMPSAPKTIIQDRIAKMKWIIQQSSKFMIHYGNHLFWINGHRERIQAANSQFSLYARTKEVIEFINTYRV